MEQSKLQESLTLKNIPMLFLAIQIGILSGIGAYIFKKLIFLVHHVFFYEYDHLFLEITRHTPILFYKLGIIIIPMLGACIVTFLITRFSLDAKGHGVPEAIYAIHYKQGKISPLVGLVKVLASAFTIGTGGSAGREGPIIQIGASIGSTFGQIIAMPSQQRVVLIAAGASSGLAATFGAPMAGLLFAIELMLVTVNAKTISIVAFAVISSICTSLFLADNTSELTALPYLLTVSHQHYLFLLIILIPFSFVVGFTSFLFIKGLYFFEVFFERHFSNPYVRHITGMACVGIIMFILGEYFGHYYVDGVGYETINDIFYDLIKNPWMLLIICLCKILATCLTLGSGGSGGIFSPGLFMGATLGAAYGVLINYFFPGQENSLIFVIAGMAGIVGSATGLSITAIILVFEVTRDYNLIIPIMMTVIISNIIRTKLSKENIFTLKLNRNGLFIPDVLERISSQRKK